ncbi:MAG: hypothetical protein S4CHLAM81_07230 [Chlamydiales bacterium]|nr:hypothetical protein [Chlamydiales bacterium]MCH9635507.1 hypothetical protein [Chlamydiales bacterium]MCH9704439.1 hypothetical protein [Chlamydiota bacterium]
MSKIVGPSFRQHLNPVTISGALAVITGIAAIALGKFVAARLSTHPLNLWMGGGAVVLAGSTTLACKIGFPSGAKASLSGERRTRWTKPLTMQEGLYYYGKSENIIDQATKLDPYYKYLPVLGNGDCCYRAFMKGLLIDMVANNKQDSVIEKIQNYQEGVEEWILKFKKRVFTGVDENGQPYRQVSNYKRHLPNYNIESSAAIVEIVQSIKTYDDICRFMSDEKKVDAFVLFLREIAFLHATGNGNRSATQLRMREWAHGGIASSLQAYFGVGECGTGGANSTYGRGYSGPNLDFADLTLLSPVEDLTDQVALSQNLPDFVVLFVTDDHFELIVRHELMDAALNHGS